MRYFMFLLLVLLVSSCSFVSEQDTKPPDKEDIVKVVDNDVQDTHKTAIDTGANKLPVIDSNYANPHGGVITDSYNKYFRVSANTKYFTPTEYGLIYTLRTINNYLYYYNKRVTNYHNQYSKVC